MSHARWIFALVSITLASLAGPGRAEEPAEDREAMGPEVLHNPTLERKAEQGILRAVPISTELPIEIALRARRVLVHYRLWGDPDWTALELRRSGAKYEGAIPCLEISTVTGDLRYYIRVHDAEGRVIATGASRARPYLVTIKHDTMIEPGESKGAKCPDPADCPAGLLGCPSERVVEIACQSDADCEGGATCSWRGFCERIDRRKSWVSLGVQQDLGVMTTAGACNLHSQENEGYACFREDGAQYTGTPVHTNTPLSGGLGPTRIVVGYERLIHYDTTLGVKLGWAFFGEGPTPREGTAFVPFSLAARATHWFGDDLFARSGLRPYVFITGGYAMVDVKGSTVVRENPLVPPYQGGNDLEQAVTLHKRAGDGFVGAGGGLSLAWQSRRAAFVEIAAHAVFPFGAFVLAPSAGVTLGF